MAYGFNEDKSKETLSLVKTASATVTVSSLASNTEADFTGSIPSMDGYTPVGIIGVQKFGPLDLSRRYLHPTGWWMNSTSEVTLRIHNISDSTSQAGEFYLTILYIKTGFAS